MDAFATALGNGLLASFIYHLQLLGPLALYSVILYFISRFIKHGLYATLGWRGVLLFAWIGTPVHELSHALAALAGRHQIDRISLFSPNKRTRTLGEVVHRYDTRSLYQRTAGLIMVAFAPFVGGSAVLALLTYFALPVLYRHGMQFTGMPLFDAGAWITGVVSNMYATLRDTLATAPWSSWWLYPYLFAVMSIGAHLVPSRDDMRGIGRPLTVVLTISLLLYAMLSGVFQIHAPFRLLLKGSACLQNLLLLAIVLNMLGVAVTALLLGVRALWNAVTRHGA